MRSNQYTHYVHDIPQVYLKLSVVRKLIVMLASEVFYGKAGNLRRILRFSIVMTMMMKITKEVVVHESNLHQK